MTLQYPVPPSQAISGLQQMCQGSDHRIAGCGRDLFAAIKIIEALHNAALTPIQHVTANVANASDGHGLSSGKFAWLGVDGTPNVRT